ncbi:MAG: hypothetical protein NTW80_04375, partial [Deltaproteobacteria bacterium]|nr:hypothetical protein [Deltaproteobacteria bacterium]
MHKRNGLETRGAGLGVKFVTLLIILLFNFACTPSTKTDEEWRGEIKDLQKEVKVLGEKLDKLEAGQHALLMVLKQAAPPPPMSVLPPQPMLPPQVQPPAMPTPMTVAQLLAGKDQYLGARVTVKGEAGPVM